jgi:hypothetical protein
MKGHNERDTIREMVQTHLLQLTAGKTRNAAWRDSHKVLLHDHCPAFWSNVCEIECGTLQAFCMYTHARGEADKAYWAQADPSADVAQWCCHWLNEKVVQLESLSRCRVR